MFLSLLGFDVETNMTQLTVTAFMVWLLCAPLPAYFDKIRTRGLWIIAGLGLLHSILVPVYSTTWVSIDHLQGVASDASNGIKTMVDTNVWLVVAVITGLSFLSGALLCYLVTKQAKNLSSNDTNTTEDVSKPAEAKAQ